MSPWENITILINFKLLQFLLDIKKTPEQALGFFDINLFLSQLFNLNEFRK